MATVSIERPVDCSLVVKAKSGETWPATLRDMDRFGFSQKFEAQARWSRWVRKAGNVSTDRGLLSLLRYSLEQAEHPLFDQEGAGWAPGVEDAMMAVLRALASVDPDEIVRDPAPFAAQIVEKVLGVLGEEREAMGARAEA